jgi:hypothetical protein
MSRAVTILHNRRLARRRAPKGGTRVVCRKGTLGLGPDLAVSVLDVSESGIRLLVREALAERQEIEVGLTGPGQARAHRLVATVVWSDLKIRGLFIWRSDLIVRTMWVLRTATPANAVCRFKCIDVFFGSCSTGPNASAVATNRS